MNFFAQQEAARKKTLRLILVYAIAVILIIAALDIIFAIALIFIEGDSSQTWNPLSWMERNVMVMVAVSAAILAFIGLASLYKMIAFRGGGGAVARQLGGTQVNDEKRDPAVRRLVNVVEEMAIASGLPVPEIYVMENESGINAFAAGFDTGDAAIAVTRGALDVFDRDELQGVIGHEFSHILNGDMRLNMRLLGPLFGIMLISMMGRIILRGMGRTRTRSSKEGAGGIVIIMLLGVGLTVIGYIGYLAGQLIQAAISRQREFLADASAVQFTRNPDGISGALKKIAAWQYGSEIINDGSAEISHMLFAQGMSSQVNGLLATHPPLSERLARLGHRLSNQELAKLVMQMGGAGRSAAPVGDEVFGFASGSTHSEHVTASPASMLDPDMDIKAPVLSVITQELYEAVHDVNSVGQVVIALLLDPAIDLRTRQLSILEQQGSEFAVERANHHWQQIGRLETDLRLPLLELAFPAIRKLTWQQQTALYGLVDALITFDDAINSFEYLLSRLLMQIMQESQHPRRRVKTARFVKLYKYQYELGVVFSVLANFGHESKHAAEQAYTAGLRYLSPQYDWPALHVSKNWSGAMDDALQRLDALRPLVKEVVIDSLKVTAGHDEDSNVVEQELLRVIAGLMHVPMPPEHLLNLPTD